MPIGRSAPLRRGLPPKRRVPVREKRLRPRRGTARSPDYLAWIRTLGCAVCSRAGGGSIVIEAAHTNSLGVRGMGQKTSDFSAIPLCPAHHRQNLDSYHRLGERRFEQEHRIDLQALVGALNRFFQRRTARNPRYTKDLDLWIDPVESNAQKLFVALGKFGAPTSDIHPSDFTEPEVFLQIGMEPVLVDIMTSVFGLDFVTARERKAMG